MTDLTTKPNAELAYRVLDHIDANPESWDQSHWYANDTDCGTTACFAGWTVALTGHEIQLGERDEFGVAAWCAIDGDADALIKDVAARELGIENAVTSCNLCPPGDCDDEVSAPGWLFNVATVREHMHSAVEAIFGPRPTGGAS